jgi:hypothetical protein
MEVNNPLTENLRATSTACVSCVNTAKTAEPLPVMDAMQGCSESNSSTSRATTGYAGNTTASSAFRNGNEVRGNLAKTELADLRLRRCRWDVNRKVGWE